MKTTIFLHTPKTAGTTFNDIIYHQYKLESLYRAKDDLVFENLPAVERNRYKMIFGHMSFGYFEKHINSDFQYITLLRDPLKRVVSDYYHILRSTGRQLNEKVKNEELSLKDYIELNEPTSENWQVKSIAGYDYIHKVCDEETYQKALENLKKYFEVVGITELFDAFLVDVSEKLNWTFPYYKRLNIGANKKELDSETKALITSRNTYDIRLYDHIKRELALKYESPKFKKSLGKFERRNRIFSRFYKVFNLPMRVLQKMKRK